VSAAEKAQAKLIRRADISPVDTLPGIRRRTLCWGAEMLVAEFEIAAGAVIPEHSHPHEQAGYVVKGKLVFTSGGTSQELRAGDGYCFPGGMAHSVAALEDSVAVDVFSPVREEYK
jgi:quercetin dioxygenase-like cupin family protein